MLLIGLKTENTGIGTYDTDYTNVSHQRMDIIAGGPNDTKETLSKLYYTMVKKGKESREKLYKLEDEIEYLNITEEEYERQTDKLLSDTYILKYDKVLIVDGIILK